MTLWRETVMKAAQLVSGVTFLVFRDKGGSDEQSVSFYPVRIYATLWQVEKILQVQI